ncbi:MAG: DegT/DnrJ/EryC1/StrS family aminotransferase [Kofleriaceae bacterium]|nr:DegT/DnrJ/EryC1/StrS family aminotransferase [Kofleriaceae bacterium]
MSEAGSPTFLPYGRHQVDDDDVAAVVEVLRGGGELTGGPRVAGFEAALSTLTGVPGVSACASGTAALQLSYAAAGLGPGDEVIVPAITFSATASAAYAVGASVRFADVDARTGLMDALATAALIGPRTRALTVVHLAGQPAQLDAFRALADRHGLVLVEDACHALGATWAGQRVPSGLADFAVCSFHPVKHVAAGEGGAVFTRDLARKRQVDKLRNHGVERDPARLGTPSPGPWYYEVQEQGWNFRLSDVACALATSQLRKLPRFLAERRALITTYQALIADRFGTGAAALVAPPVELPGRTSAYHLCALRVDFARAGVDRGTVMTELRARGIGTQVHYMPLPMHPYHRRRLGADADRPLPGAAEYYEHTLSVPLYSGLTAADATRVVDALVTVLGQRPSRSLPSVAPSGRNLDAADLAAQSPPRA